MVTSRRLAELLPEPREPQVRREELLLLQQVSECIVCVCVLCVYVCVCVCVSSDAFKTWSVCSPHLPRVSQVVLMLKRLPRRLHRTRYAATAVSVLLNT